MKRGKAKLANEGVGIRLALVYQPGNTLTSDLTRDRLPQTPENSSGQVRKTLYIKYIDVPLTGFFFQEPMRPEMFLKKKKKMNKYSNVDLVA